MNDQLLLDFPVLQPDSGNFLEGVEYTVKAENFERTVKVIHRLAGRSYIYDMIENREAVYSVQLLYQGHAKREVYKCDFSQYVKGDNEIVAVQEISKTYPYAPEITPSIVLLQEATISADEASGLTEFWPTKEQYYIPAFSRIAYYDKLTFTSGEFSSLMTVVWEESFGPGTFKTVVEEQAQQGQIPVTLLCSKDVYDELTQVSMSKPTNVRETMASAMVTHALCAVYGYMQRKFSEQSNDENNDDWNSNISSVLQAHLELLKEKTDSDWSQEGFNPGLAASKMHPFVIEALRND